MNVAILTIGDEVSSGQIINRNSAWLAARLEDLQLTVSLHLTVQDIDSQIIDALHYCGAHASFIVTTGGLGPTRDDLTRHAVASWAGQSLVFHEDSWRRLEAQFSDRQIPLAESNRQQCFFPRIAKFS